MKILYCLIPLMLLLDTKKLSAQINVELLHQLIEHSKDEYERQVSARNKQSLASSYQQINSTQTSRFKNQYRLINERFQVISSALEALGFSNQAITISNQISESQSQIFSLSTQLTQYSPLVILWEQEMLQKAQKLVRYILALSLGRQDLTKMKSSDRRILLDYGMQELYEINSASKNLARLLKHLHMYHHNKATNLSLDRIRDLDINLADRLIEQYKAQKR